MNLLEIEKNYERAKEEAQAAREKSDHEQEWLDKMATATGLDATEEVDLNAQRYLANKAALEAEEAERQLGGTPTGWELRIVMNEQLKKAARRKAMEQGQDPDQEEHLRQQLAPPTHTHRGPNGELVSMTQEAWDAAHPVVGIAQTPNEGDHE